MSKEKEIKKILEDPSIGWLCQCLGIPLNDLNAIIESVEAVPDKTEADNNGEGDYIIEHLTAGGSDEGGCFQLRDPEDRSIYAGANLNDMLLYCWWHDISRSEVILRAPDKPDAYKESAYKY